MQSDRPFRILCWGQSNFLAWSTGHNIGLPIFNTWFIQAEMPEMAQFINWASPPFNGRAHAAIQFARELRHRHAIPRERRIEVVINSRNGMSLAEWTDDAKRPKPNSMFAESLALTEAARWSAPADIVFGLQGEYDSTIQTGYHSARDWADGVTFLYDAWKAHGLVSAETKFLHGEFGQWFGGPGARSIGLAKLRAWHADDPERRYVVPSDGLDPEPGRGNTSHYSGPSKDKLAERAAIILMKYKSPITRGPIHIEECRKGELTNEDVASLGPSYFLGADDLKKATHLKASEPCDVYLPLVVSILDPIDIALTVNAVSIRLLCLQPLVLPRGERITEKVAGFERPDGDATANYFATDIPRGEYRLRSGKRFVIERSAAPVRAAVYGTSNGLFKNGYWDGIATALGGFNSKNHSIGGSAAFVWFATRDMDWASQCQVAILEYCVNDGMMIEDGTNSIDNWERAMTCAVRELRAVGCEPVLFIMPSQPLLRRDSILRKAALAFAERLALAVMDVYKMIERLKLLDPTLDTAALFLDPAHLRPQISMRIGKVMADLLTAMPRRASLDRSVACTSYRFVEIETLVGLESTRLRGTALLQREFFFLGADGSIVLKLDKSERLAAIALDLSKTNGCMVVRGETDWSKSWSNPYFKEFKDRDNAVVFTVLPIMGPTRPDPSGDLRITMVADADQKPDESWGMTGLCPQDPPALSIAAVLLEGPQRNELIPCFEGGAIDLVSAINDETLVSVFGMRL